MAWFVVAIGWLLGALACWSCCRVAGRADDSLEEG